MKPGLVRLAVALAVLGTVAACGPVKAPEECPFTGSRNDAVFAQHFTRMALVTEGVALPETGGEEDLTFSPNDRLELVVMSLADTQLQVCISERKGGGKVVYSQTHALPQGEARLSLASFKPNPYVVRVAVNEVLVRNLTFSTK